jgi:hypothetical protein
MVHDHTREAIVWDIDEDDRGSARFRVCKTVRRSEAN